MTEERGLAHVEEKRQVAKSQVRTADLPARIVLAGVSELSRYLG